MVITMVCLLRSRRSSCAKSDNLVVLVVVVFVFVVVKRRRGWRRKSHSSCSCKRFCFRVLVIIIVVVVVVVAVVVLSLSTLPLKRFPTSCTSLSTRQVLFAQQNYSLSLQSRSAQKERKRVAAMIISVFPSPSALFPRLKCTTMKKTSSYFLFY